MKNNKTINLTIELLYKTKKYLKIQCINFILLVLCITLSLSFGFIIKNLIDEGIRGKSKEMLLFYSMGYLLIILLAFSFNILKGYLLSVISESIVKDYRKELFQSIKRISYIFLSSSNTSGKILTGIINDVGFIGTYYSTIILQTLVNLLYILATSVILIYWDYKIFLLCLIFVPTIYTFTYFFNKKIYSVSKKSREQLEKLQSFSHEYIYNIKNIIFSNNQTPIQEVTEHQVDEMAKKNISNLFWLKFSQQTIKYVSQIPNVIIYLYGGYLIINHGSHFSLGKLLAIVFYIEMFMHGINVIGENIAHASKSIVSLEQINRILAMGDLKNLPENTQNFLKNNSIDSIEIHNASLELGGKEIFKNLNFSFKRGEINLIKGKNGSGKSSLLFSILGLYGFRKGEIFINKHKIKHPYTYGLNSFFSCSFQNKPCLNFLGIQKTFSISKKHPMFDYYKDKLGIKLEHLKNICMDHYSGGEKQKISILNTLCFNSSILIFDEPTNHLDEISIQNFIQILNEIKNKKLIILVSHHKALVRAGTRVLSLQKTPISR